MIYTVRPGDSLWSIASALCRNPYLWPQIADDNHIRGSTILVGQSLVVSDALCSRRAAGALSGMVASGGQSVAGAVVTMGLGSIIGGTAGYFGADWVSDHIDPN